MRPTNVADQFTVDGDVEGYRVRMSIDEASINHLMNVMTNLYNDRQMAVIREYSTNARDAQIEAGVDEPIEVSLPNVLSPFLRIKDHGVGLSLQGIEETYSRYGASTKRDSDEVNGVLGLGCKSALTYTSQFTLVGIKDGIKTTVSISREDDGVGAMTIIDEEETEERNGVEVMIPCETYNNMEEKARFFFSFWEPGTVLIDGEEPEQIKGTPVGENLLIVKRIDAEYSDRIVMGGVAYPTNIRNPLSEDYNLVAYVGMGDVEFAPSREALRDTSLTNKCRERISDEFEGKIENAITESIQEAETPYLAMKSFLAWKDILPRKRDLVITWKDLEIPTTFETFDASPMLVTKREGRTLSGHTKYKALPPSTLINSVIVTGYDKMHNFTAAHKKKLIKWAEEKNLSPVDFVLTTPPVPFSDETMEWLGSTMVVGWEEIKAVQLERKANVYGERVSGSFDIYEDGERRNSVMADEFDTSKPIYFTTTNEFGDKWSTARALYNKFLGESTLVEMGANRVNKFKRGFPTAKALKDALADVYADLADQIDPVELKIYQISRHHTHRDLAKLDGRIVPDPELRDAIIYAQQNPDQSLFKDLKEFDWVRHMLDVSDRLTDDEWESPLERYPLVSEIPYYVMKEHEDHVYLYINGVYAATIGKDKNNG